MVDVRSLERAGLVRLQIEVSSHVKFAIVVATGLRPKAGRKDLTWDAIYLASDCRQSALKPLCP